MTWTFEELLGFMLGLLFLCSLPAIIFHWHTSRIPEGSLWIDNETDEIRMVCSKKMCPSTSREIVVAKNLENTFESRSDPAWFLKSHTRVPKKDEPFYLLANI